MLLVGANLIVVADWFYACCFKDYLIGVAFILC